jgi:hypothetical protein
MSKWALIAILGLQAHFAASYLVPLDAPSQKEFGGLLRWFWPWAYGDSGPLGQLTPTTDLPMAGLLLAMIAGGLLIVAAVAVAGLWVPAIWWRALATCGASLLVCLLALFFGPTKLVPLGVAFATLYMAVWNPELVAHE